MSFLSTRLDLLRRSQNPDGGWGYLPGKQSWLEPTVYASLALHNEPAADRAWQLLSSWQNPDGSWRPSQDVRTSTWATALSVTLAAVRAESGTPLQTGAAWLLNAEGAESTRARGWAWTANSSSSPEPTAHALVALKKAFRVPGLGINPRALARRLTPGEQRLFGETDRNSASFVLLGLQGSPGLESWLESGRSQLVAPQTPALTRTWLRLALRLHGETPAYINTTPSRDVMLTALEALADPDGNHNLLQSRAGGGPA